eukprot:3253594-Pyramimonas_sp.AAC.1
MRIYPRFLCLIGAGEDGRAGGGHRDGAPQAEGVPREVGSNRSNNNNRGRKCQLLEKSGGETRHIHIQLSMEHSTAFDPLKHGDDAFPLRGLRPLRSVDGLNKRLEQDVEVHRTDNRRIAYKNNIHGDDALPSGRWTG